MSYSANWEITLHILEKDEQTAAHVTVETDHRTLSGDGFVLHAPDDLDATTTDYQLAAGRALIELGTRLVDQAVADIRRAAVAG